MTELVRHEGNGWVGGRSAIDLAPQVWDLAQRIARTEFVPAALRARPEAVMAAMLTGHELGVGVMQALAKIHIIDGRPSIAAELMRALVLQHGHELWVEESTGTRCTIVARRKTSTRETRVTWTLDDAERAHLKGKDNWRKYPRAMLIARATGEVCRLVFPDLLAGMSYTAEELTDGEVVDLDDLQAAAAVPVDEGPKRKRARAVRAATRPAVPADPAGPAPPLPGEEDVEDAEVVEPYEGPDEDLGAKAYAPEQIIAMRLKELGVIDRDAKLRLCGTIIGRQVMTTKELGADEVKKVLATISEEGYRPPDGLVAPKPPAGRRRAAGGISDPERWAPNDWETFCTSRGVKVTDLLEEAGRLANEAGVLAPVTTDQIPGLGIGAVLVHWCES